MKIRDLQQPVNEIDRRGFLKGMGAAAAVGAVPGLANAKSTATIPELIAISKKIKSIFAKNIVIAGAVPVPTAPGRFRFTFDMQGKLLTKERPESSGDEKLDQAVLNSATDIPPDIIALFKPEPGSKSVFINITVKDDWWKAGIQNGQNTRQQPAQQPVQQNQTPESELSQYSVKGVRFGMTKEQLKGLGLEVFGNSFSGDLRVSIAGIGQWSSKFQENKLVELYSFPKSNLMYEMVETFKEGYGKPQIREFKSRTKGGLELNDFSATWLVKDAVISMNKHIDRDTGSIFISFKPHLDKEAAARRAEKEKKAKDF
jgi:hypothetical protein